MIVIPGNFSKLPQAEQRAWCQATMAHYVKYFGYSAAVAFDFCKAHFSVQFALAGVGKESDLAEDCAPKTGEPGAALTGSNASSAPAASLAVAAPDSANRLKGGDALHFMVMPEGEHEADFGQVGTGRSVSRRIKVTPESAKALDDQLKAVNSRSAHQAYLDFDHSDQKASAWPQSYYWKDGSDGSAAGVYCQAILSSEGADAINGKNYRAFSPVFHTDSHMDPCGVACNPDASLNFGGLVNDPAFKETSPLWAKNPNSNPQSTTAMITTKEIPAIHARKKALENELAALNRASNEIQVVEGAVNTLRHMGALTAKNRNAKSLEEKVAIARQQAAVYKAAIKGRADVESCPLGEVYPLAGADYTDPAGNIGTLSGTLVAQETLELFKYDFPFLNSVWTDFAPTEGEYGQTAATRIVITPPVSTYNSAINGATGYPYGWQIITPAQTKDVLVKLDEHVGVPIMFDSNTLAATARKLFDEQAGMAVYALAKHFVEKVYALLTPANFNAYAVASAKVPVPYPTFVKGLGDFGRSALIDLGTALTTNEVPLKNRSVLLMPFYAGQLLKDPSLVTFFFGQQAPEAVTESRLPRIAGFQPIEAPNLTANNATPNLVGFAGHRASIVIKARLGGNYMDALGPAASYGRRSVVIDPDTQLAMSLIDFVEHTGGYGERRLEMIIGAAPGDTRGGVCITSQ